MLLGIGGNPEAPVAAQKELQAEFPECFYEWMPRARRWAVKRRVPWEEVEKLVAKGLLHELEIAAHLEERQRLGYFGAGDSMVIHAFTVRAPDGGYLEPGPYVVQALLKADSSRHPDGAAGVLTETLKGALKREEELNQWTTDQIEEAVKYHDAALRGLPAQAYPNNPLGDKK